MILAFLKLIRNIVNSSHLIADFSAFLTIIGLLDNGIGRVCLLIKFQGMSKLIGSEKFICQNFGILCKYSMS
jgi:hypothetical protein